MSLRFKKPRRPVLGFTLIEIVVAILIGTTVVLAAMTFAQQQIQAYSRAEKVMEITQSGRAALDLLARDLANAGSGLSHHAVGQFIGLELGQFQSHWISPTDAVPSNAVFDATDMWVSSWGTVTDPDSTVTKLLPTQTDDIGLYMADGEWVTVVDEPTPGSNIVVCAPSSVKNQEAVVLHTADGMAAAAFTVNPSGTAGVAAARSACPSNVTCQVGASNTATACENWTITPVTQGNKFFFETDAGASSALYLTGWAASNVRRVVWFVQPNGQVNRSGTLRRAINETCTDRTCGGLVADNVETLQMRAYRWTASGWTFMTSNADRKKDCRIKVDIELVVRGRDQDQVGKTPPSLLLHNKTWTADQVVRRVYRTSVELKNSGKMQYQNGGDCT